jgi:hypothetical protein
MTNNFSLYPLYEFFPVNTVNPRCSDWLIDCGALETCIVSEEENLNGQINITLLPHEIHCSKIAT